MRPGRPSRRTQTGMLLALFALAALVGVRTLLRDSEALAQATVPVSSPDAAAGVERIHRAFRDRESGVMVEASGVVRRLLADDDEGSRHQRFIVEIGGDHSLLVSHNIDLAPRVDLTEGDVVAFRGQFEWNDRGGVLHWTHHDPQGRRQGGWIRHDGRLHR